jgi:tetrahydromethanopterin S-methyltransferase subunit G
MASPTKTLHYFSPKDSGNESYGRNLAMWKAIDRVLQKLDALEKRVEEVEKELKELAGSNK